MTIFFYHNFDTNYLDHVVGNIVDKSMLFLKKELDLVSVQWNRFQNGDRSKKFAMLSNL
jgi:hypothetical protein